jgi:serine/threonine protein kinase
VYHLTPAVILCIKAPEIIQGKGMYVPSSIDVWSCGIILYIMFAGQFPFTEATHKCELFMKYMNQTFEWPSHFSPDLVQLLQGLTSLSPLTQ